MDTIKTDTHIDYFSEENRTQYLEETYQSLNALLDDAFGDDQNEIRSEFPANSKRDTIKIENTKVALTYLNESTDPFIEVVIQIGFNGSALGEYQSVYSISGELEDESFFFE